MDSLESKGQAKMSYGREQKCLFTVGKIFETRLSDRRQRSGSTQLFCSQFSKNFKRIVDSLIKVVESLIKYCRMLLYNCLTVMYLTLHCSILGNVSIPRDFQKFVPIYIYFNKSQTKLISAL